MGKRYVTNDTPNVMFVGGTMIPAGEGREVDASCLPADEAAAPPAPETDPADEEAARLRANLAELLAKPMKEILPVLEGLSDATLAALEALESEDETPRKSLLAKLGEQRLKLAAAKTGDAG